MRFSSLNWMQVEDYLRRDDRVVIPLGSTEQHAYLSLATDSILAETMAQEASAPLGVPVTPVLSFGMTPFFLAYPGTISLRMETYGRLLTDILDSLVTAGFRRFAFVNGHGGNTPAHMVTGEWLGRHGHCRVLWHDWWCAPKTMAAVRAIDPVASHASWMENFAMTRLANVAMPAAAKAPVTPGPAQILSPADVRKAYGDGNFGGHYQRSDAEMDRIWAVAVAETRAQIADGWAE